MFKFVITAIAMLNLFGCASTSSVKTIQAELDAHVSAVDTAQTAQKEVDARQDANIAELSNKMDRAFTKSK